MKPEREPCAICGKRTTRIFCLARGYVSQDRRVGLCRSCEDGGDLTQLYRPLLKVGDRVAPNAA